MRQPKKWDFRFFPQILNLIKVHFLQCAFAPVVQKELYGIRKFIVVDPVNKYHQILSVNQWEKIEDFHPNLGRQCVQPRLHDESLNVIFRKNQKSEEN